MRYSKQFILLLSFYITIVACTKENPPSAPLASLTVVNTVVAGKTARLGNNAATISNNSFTHYSIRSGLNRFYVWPAGDSLRPYFNQEFQTEQGEIFTLFLAGAADSIQGIILKESLPYLPDSTFGIRFANMSPGSPPVKITLSTLTAGDEFGAIAYKQISSFRKYSATSTAGSYTFQVRDASTNSIISSITLSGASLRFKNITLVLRGIVNGLPAAGLTRVNHYLP